MLSRSPGPGALGGGPLAAAKQQESRPAAQLLRRAGQGGQRRPSGRFLPRAASAVARRPGAGCGQEAPVLPPRLLGSHASVGPQELRLGRGALSSSWVSAGQQPGGCLENPFPSSWRGGGWVDDAPLAETPRPSRSWPSHAPSQLRENFLQAAWPAAPFPGTAPRPICRKGREGKGRASLSWGSRPGLLAVAVSTCAGRGGWPRRGLPAPLGLPRAPLLRGFLGL